MFSFKKSQRLRVSKQFKSVFSARQKITTHNMSAFWKDNDIDEPRLGIAVSKKWVPLAVNRNRIKRVIRESFRLSRLPINKDIVIVVYTKTGNLSNEQCVKACEALWGKLIKFADKPA